VVVGELNLKPLEEQKNARGGQGGTVINRQGNGAHEFVEDLITMRQEASLAEKTKTESLSRRRRILFSPFRCVWRFQNHRGVQDSRVEKRETTKE